MPSLPEENGCWLSRGSTEGIAIRDDVRAAAAKVWGMACRETRIAMGDDAETAALMEIAVAQTSQYLNSPAKRSAPSSAKAVLLKVFRRLLYRRAKRWERLEPIGHEVELRASVPSWEDQVVSVLFLEKLRRYLSQESVNILLLRGDGRTWAEIAQAMNSTTAAVRNSFWRDVDNAKNKLRIGTTQKEVTRAKIRSARKGTRKPSDEIPPKRSGTG